LDLQKFRSASILGFVPSSFWQHSGNARANRFGTEKYNDRWPGIFGER
jgi:hypothetical protein